MFEITLFKNKCKVQGRKGHLPGRGEGWSGDISVTDHRCAHCVTGIAGIRRSLDKDQEDWEKGH